jgi:hypothetical protein
MRSTAEEALGAVRSIAEELRQRDEDAATVEAGSTSDEAVAAGAADDKAAEGDGGRHVHLHLHVDEGVSVKVEGGAVAAEEE